MERIIIDDNGNVMGDVLQIRNKEIIEKLQPAFDMLMAEKASNKKAKIGYRMGYLLDNAFRSYGLMTVDDFLNLTKDDIQYYWDSFRDLISHYIVYFELSENKQDFCAYLGITTSQFEQLEQHDDDEIRRLCASINDSFVGLGFKSSENGNADSSAVRHRLGAKKAGHSVISAKEELVVEALSQRPSSELMREAQNLIGSGKRNRK